MLSSPDAAALDQLEELIDELSPPQKKFWVYPIKHIRASEMWYDLTDYFKEDLEKEDDNGFDDWWWGYRSRNQEKGPTGLAKRRKLMITWDVPSNSILVANASPSQLSEIEQLIETFDRPPRNDSVEIRDTMPVKILYSKPSVIEAAIKDVYRELLSTKDKEFDRGDKRGEQRTTAERVTVFNYPGSGDNSSDRATPVKVSFDGALSLGADDVSGILIVSAQRGILNEVVELVRKLDNEAAPTTTIQVHRVNGNVSAEYLQKALDRTLRQPWLGGRPEQQPAQSDKDQRDGDGRRDNRDGRQSNGDQREGNGGYGSGDDSN
jgi:type II secretory pathway component GspD/PulD (secretin)